MKAETCRLGKETLSFLAASAAFSVALYNFLVSGPLLLRDSNPVSAEAGPSRVCIAEPTPLEPEDVYLAGDRNSPFSPATLAQRRRKVDEPHPSPRTNLPGPTPGSAGDVLTQVREPKPHDESPQPKCASDLQFVGTAFVGAHVRALLRPKDGPARLCVKPGDAIPEYGCTVTRIAKQSIHLSDGEHPPVVLSDGR